jgi:hypothetical protein
MEASNETTENYLKALEAISRDPPKIYPLVSKLLYSEDGSIIGITDEREPLGLWMQIDREDFQSKHGAGPYLWLRFVDGEIINLRPSSDRKKKLGLVSGSTWQADREFRLILWSDDTDGWSKRDN